MILNKIQWKNLKYGVPQIKRIRALILMNSQMNINKGPVQ